MLITGFNLTYHGVASSCWLCNNCISHNHTYPPSIISRKHLDWQSINLDEMTFPQDFTWGVATASHQIEGGNSNNWTQFEERENKERSGDACDHWNLWNKDHDLLTELGVSSYRFSIEWSRIEPNEGEWNESQYKYILI